MASGTVKLAAALLIAAIPHCDSFQHPAIPSSSTLYSSKTIKNSNIVNGSSDGILPFTRHHLFLDNETSDERSTIEIVACPGDSKSIHRAAEFLLDAFWLDARHMVKQTASEDPDDNVATTLTVSNDTRRSLCQEQAADLLVKYGHQTGRLLDSCILTALDSKTGDLLGLVCVSTCLFDSKTEELLSAEDSEQLLQAALASLGPRVRRKFTDYTAGEMAKELFGNDLQVGCCISNLAVMPAARKGGVATKLCDKAERIASDEWGYEKILLKVEADNLAARHLYEKKLSYSLRCRENATVAFRVDTEEGSFVESEADTLILFKSI